MKKLWIVIPLLATLSCFRASGPKFSPMVFDSSNKSVIYIYRVARTTSSVICPHVYINDHPLGPIINGGYIAICIRGGKHKVRMEVEGWIGEAILRLSTQTGQSKYVRVDTEYSYNTSSTRRVFRLVPVADDVAIKEITKCRMIKTVR